jgi:hypothetical protein
MSLAPLAPFSGTARQARQIRVSVVQILGMFFRREEKFSVLFQNYFAKLLPVHSIAHSRT